MKPAPLKEDDSIAIAAPAGPFDRGRFLRAISLLRKSPFRVVFKKGIFSRHGYLAGNDRRRSRELNAYLASPRYKALLFARGGFGCQRILPHFTGRCAAKVVVGSSDLTVVLNHLWQQFRLPSYYGPMVAPHLALRKNVSRLEQALTDPDFHQRQKCVASKVLRPGSASGRLIGGCLSLVVATLATPWEIRTDGSILFLEDANEEPYAVDRMLTQLEQAGKFRLVRGIVFGTFRQGRVLFPPQIESVVREKFRSFRGPVLWGVRFGHCPDPLFIPIGGKGRIEGNRLILTEGVLQGGGHRQ